MQGADKEGDGGELRSLLNYFSFPSSLQAGLHASVLTWLARSVIDYVKCSFSADVCFNLSFIKCEKISTRVAPDSQMCLRSDYA